MAEPNYNAGLEQIVGTVNNNRDWAMKAYSVANDEKRLQMAQQQNDIQMKAQKLAVADKVSEKVYQAAMTTNPTLKKAQIKSLRELTTELGVPINPENEALLTDATLAPQVAKALGTAFALPEGPQRQSAILGIMDLVGGDGSKTLEAVKQMAALNNRSELQEARGAAALAKAERSALQTEIKGVGDLRREYTQNVTNRFKTQEDAVNSIEGLLKMKPNKFSDQALMGRFQAAAEGVSSVLRQEDINRYGGSVGLLDRFNQEIGKVQSSQTYTPEARKLMGEVNTFLKKKVQEGKYDAGLAIKEEADARGIPYNRVFGNDASIFNSNQQAAAAPAQTPAAEGTPVSARAPVSSAAQGAGNASAAMKLDKGKEDLILSQFNNIKNNPQTVQKFRQALAAKGVSPADISRLTGGK